MRILQRALFYVIILLDRAYFKLKVEFLWLFFDEGRYKIPTKHLKTNHMVVFFVSYSNGF